MKIPLFIIILPTTLILCRVSGPGMVWHAFRAAELATAAISALIFTLALRGKL